MEEQIALWENARALKIDLMQMYMQVGEFIASEIEKNYPKNKSILVICGMGGNGVDGMCVAYHLLQNKFSKIEVKIIGRIGKSEDNLFLKVFENLKKLSSNPEYKLYDIKITTDVFADDIKKSDVIVEALVGTGMEGKNLTKRFKDVISKISKFKSEIISIDLPAKGYTPYKIFDVGFPKSLNSTLVNVSLPTSLTLFCGPGERKILKAANSTTHKGKNGQILVLYETKIDESSINIITKEYETKLQILKISDIPKNLDEELGSFDAICLINLEKSFLNYSILKNLLHFFPKPIFLVNDTNLKTEDIKGKANICLLYHKSKISQFENNFRRNCIENKNFGILCGTQIQLINPNSDFKVLNSPAPFEEKIPEILAYQIACYCTHNDLWLSIRASI